MLPLIALLLVCVAGGGSVWAAPKTTSAFNDTVAADSQLRHTLRQTSVGVGGGQLGELVAIGAITMLDRPPIGGATKFGQSTGARLVDRIATATASATPTAKVAAANVERPLASKLDYIIDFMRANKLERFCELLTRAEPQVTQLVERLNAMEQFTLFVPTNEAILLTPSDQWRKLIASADETADFIRAHASDELIVPAAGALGAQRVASSVAYELSSSAAAYLARPSTVRARSLAGTTLQVTTAPVELVATNQPLHKASAAMAVHPNNATKFELFVNGARVLSGQSHALQEPNNTALTYAIVHLIDRPLRPSTSELTLVELIGRLAPKMANYLRQLNDADLNDRLLTSARLTTVFAPNDNAFAALPERFMRQLEANRTALEHFLRSHFVDGLYHSTQLAASEAPKNLLASLAKTALEIETKALQTRSLVLVNSIPLLETDASASNGLVHVTTRPIVERELLEQCNCGASVRAQPELVGSDALDKAAMYAKLWPSAGQESSTSSSASSSSMARQPQESATNLRAPNWSVGRALAPTNAQTATDTLRPLAGNEIEREDSSRLTVWPNSNSNSNERDLASAESSALVARQRRQRSGSLANNKDFYRPSTAPANLLITSSAKAAEPLGADSTPAASVAAASEQRRNGQDDWTRPMAADLFEVERYKVLNASSRQRLRAEQQHLSRFAYDKPLARGHNDATPPTGSTTSNKRAYSDLGQATQANQTLATVAGSTGESQPLASAASSIRNQRLLKFRPEEARDTRAQDENAYELLGARNSADLGAGSKLAPVAGAANFGGCAFYDTECKRLMGKLVRLPALNSKQARKAASTLIASAPQVLAVQNAIKTQQNATVDTSFADSADKTGLLGAFAAAAAAEADLRRAKQQNALNQSTTGTTRLFGAQLNQPLPPWTSDEQQVVRHAQQVRPETSGPLDVDIARIAFGGQKSASNGGQQRPQGSNPSGGRTTAQVLLVPVKVFEEAGLSFGAATRPNNYSIFEEAASKQQQQSTSQRLARPIPSSSFNNFQGFHQPTPRPPQQVHQPSATGPFSRTTNFTTIDTWADTDTQPTAPNVASAAAAAAAAAAKQSAQPSGQLMIAGQVLPVLPPRSPVAFRKERPAQLQMDNNGSLGANFELNPSSGVKQARKLTRLQIQEQQQQPLQSLQTQLGPQVQGDILVTSARLVSHRSNLTSGGALTTLASNHQPAEVSASGGGGGSSHLVRSVASPPLQSQSQSSDQIAAEYFQNRTIADIMDDSGLRIDGQQVTFVRLKECLAEADLLKLVTQADQAVTIFMPTDTAFERLVQLQVQMHQRERQSRQTRQSSDSVSARLADPNRRHLLPLVLRATRGGQRTETDATDALARLQDAPLLPTVGATTAPTGPHLSGSASGAPKLTLDCSSNQVRQLLLDHISARFVAPKQLVSDTSLSALTGRQLLLSSVPSKKIVVVDGQPVIAATRAKNGMVYVVNKFLNLTQQVPNVVDLIETQPNLTTFLSYLSFSSLADRLRRESGPITVLAPTNDAFDQLSTAARHLINSDPSALADILRGHVVDGAQFGKLISMRNRLKTMNADQFIEARVLKPNLYQLDTQVTPIRLVGTTSNGVVNSIDKLIVPAWLKVSMGETTNSMQPMDALATRANNSPSGGFFSSAESTGAVSVGPSELESALAGDGNLMNARAATQANNNLPPLNGQPLRFEQPGARLTLPNSILALSSSNGLGFDGGGGGSSSTTSDASNLIGGTGDGSNTGSSSSDFRSAEPMRTNGSQSPFLRIAANLTSSNSLGPMAGDRIRPNSPLLQMSQHNNDSQPTAAANFGRQATNATSASNKNMLLIQKLADLMEARKFVRYLLKARLGESLKADMNYVVLVPTDQAVERLPRQIIELLERDAERLADLVNYHVLETTFEYINTIPDGSKLSSLNEKDILFDWHRNNTILTASGAVVLAGIQEDNIALLIVDRVLYPTPGDLLSIVSKSPILSNFTQIVRNAGLERQLTLNGPYTLFAPSDFAFNQLDQRQLDFLQRNKETAKRFLLRHLSQPAIFTSSIALASTSQAKPTNSISQLPVPSLTISNSLGEDLTLRQRNDYFSVNDVNFSYADVAATNGVIHVIDGLL